MLRAAAWILEQEFKAIDWIAADDARVTDVIMLKIVVGGMTGPLWGMVGLAPHWQISRAQAAASWAVKDIAHTRAATARYGRLGGKFRTMTAFNYYSRTLAFASRGGWRFAAIRVGSKFLGPVGVALLMYDAWLTGIWIGEQLFGEMD